MSVQSFIKIEKSSDGWTCPGHALTHNKVLIFAQTPVNIKVSMSSEKSSDGWTCPGHALTHNKVLIFAQTPVNIKVSMSSAPKLALVSASRYKSGI